MYEQYPYRVDFLRHDGGLVNSETGLVIARNQSPDLLNARPLGLGKWGPRNGFEILGDNISAAGSCRSLFKFNKSGTEILIRSRGTTLEYLNGATWAAIPGIPAYTSDKEFGFENDNQYVYFGNGIENFSRWDGTGSSITEYSGNPKGNIFAFYLRRLCVAGDPSNPATVYYSKTGNPTDFTFSTPRVADDGGSILIGEAGDKITSLKVLLTPDGKSPLVVFKKSSRVYAVTFATDGTPSVTELKRETGALNHRTTLIFENDILFIDETNHVQSLGFRENIFNALHKEQASDNIEGGAQDLDFFSGCAWYFKKERFAIFCGKQFNAQVNDICFVYYQKYRSWWKWVGINANQFAEYQGKLVWASSTDQNVYQMTERYDDNNNPIEVYRDTKDIDLTDAEVPGAGFLYKKTRFVFVDGFMSENSKLDIGLIYGGDVNTLVSKTIKGDGSTVDPAVSNALGYVILGHEAFGGSAKTSSAFSLRHFTARLSFDAYSALSARIRIKQNEAGAPFVIIKSSIWMSLESDGKFPDVKKV